MYPYVNATQWRWKEKCPIGRLRARLIAEGIAGAEKLDGIDEEVDAQLEMLRKNLTKMEPIEEERGAQEGDFLLIDYEGFKDDKPFEETQKTENFTLKLGDAHVSKEFDDGLVGMNPEEEREVKVMPPPVADPERTRSPCGAASEGPSGNQAQGPSH